VSHKRIMLVGEAYEEKEEELGAPFVGTSGWILDGMLSQVGLDRRDCYLTNVFNLRPKPSNDVKNLCGTKVEGIPGMPVLQKGKYVLAKYKPELDRLFAEINKVQPNVIVALGATAAWALLRPDRPGIKAIRGAVALTHPALPIERQFKVVPTYHPAAVGRDWSSRPVTIADLDKAKRESETPEFRRPARELWLYPTLDDLAEFERRFILPATDLGSDIETWGNQITCISFGTATHAIIIPFISELRPGKNYWPTIDEELEAWNYVRRWSAMKPTVFQNGMYDIQFLYRSYGIAVPQAKEDTMLLHHAWQPEMEKGLGFLASIYTDEVSWKFMRKGLMKHD
jgi:uracil-DNA glycosylase